jgi:hypothetical protein
MSEVKGTVCDQCKKIEMDRKVVTETRIEIQEICNDFGEATKVCYPSHVATK